MPGYNVAIVGATGLVGQEFIKILKQRSFPMEYLELLASDRSAGRKISVSERELTVKETTAESF
ncbi:MAG: aspartate-semialdehyde dehydrogenase, partial [Dehalococcoidales bacterium]